MLLFSFGKDREEATAHLPGPPHPSAPGPSLLGNTPWGPWSPVWGTSRLLLCPFACLQRHLAGPPPLHLFELVPLSGLPRPFNPGLAKPSPLGSLQAGHPPPWGPTGPALGCHRHWLPHPGAADLASEPRAGAAGGPRPRGREESRAASTFSLDSQRAGRTRTGKSWHPRAQGSGNLFGRLLSSEALQLRGNREAQGSQTQAPGPLPGQQANAVPVTAVQLIPEASLLLLPRSDRQRPAQLHPGG